MFLAEVFAENFRLFGTQKDHKHLSMRLNRGLNLVAGENDSGKTALVDAIRYVLWTTTQEYVRLQEDDFHIKGQDRARELTIRLTFRDLSTAESGRFLQLLTVEEGKACLHLTMRGTLLTEDTAAKRRGRNTDTEVRCGKAGDGPRIEREVRDFLRVTYLRPLRDAETELAAGRTSRLSQILAAHPDAQAQQDVTFDEINPDETPKTLVDIMRQAEHRIGQNKMIGTVQSDLNETLENFSVADEVLSGAIAIARGAELRHILEKLELTLSPISTGQARTRRGLGHNNVLFMAAELLLLGADGDSALPLLLIEEPEAHLHPQKQLRLIEFLEEKAAATDGSHVQMLLTTHSPNLASKANLDNVIIMYAGQAYPLASDYTKLDPSDYRFLSRFLDVTRANLFFAKAVVIVEGDAENLLLPTVARLLDRSFSQHGVSIVNVGHVGLFRYSRIFQRTTGPEMPVRVARVCDRDIVPDAAKDHFAKPPKRTESDFTTNLLAERVAKRQEGDDAIVKTFVSPRWTLEFDLAVSGLAEEVHAAIRLAKAAHGKSAFLTARQQAQTIADAALELRSWRQEGLSDDEIAVGICEPLIKKTASKAETAQFLATCLERRYAKAGLSRDKLPEYLVSAIDFATRNDLAAGDVDA